MNCVLGRELCFRRCAPNLFHCGHHSLLWQMVLDFKFNDKAFSLTHCILMDSLTVICWTSSFVTLGVSGLFRHFYSVLDEKSC